MGRLFSRSFGPSSTTSSRGGYIELAALEIFLSFHSIRKEVEKAIQNLKENKAPGLYSIVVKLIKLAPKEVISSQLLLKIWEEEVVPEGWTRSLICTIFKKEDRFIRNNYRDVSLLSVPGKAFG